MQSRQLQGDSRATVALPAYRNDQGNARRRRDRRNDPHPPPVSFGLPRWQKEHHVPGRFHGCHLAAQTVQRVADPSDQSALVRLVSAEALTVVIQVGYQYHSPVATNAAHLPQDALDILRMMQRSIRHHDIELSVLEREVFRIGTPRLETPPKPPTGGRLPGRVHGLRGAIHSDNAPFLRVKRTTCSRTRPCRRRGPARRRFPRPSASAVSPIHHPSRLIAFPRPTSRVRSAAFPVDPRAASRTTR